MKNNSYRYSKIERITRTKYFTFKDDKSPSNLLFFLLKTVVKAVNKITRTLAGVELTRSKILIRNERVNYPITEEIKKLQRHNLARVIEEFFKGLSLNRRADQLLSDIEEYDRLFRNFHISSLNGGMGYNNGLMVFCFSRSVDCKYIIESGVWRGFTTYLLDAGSSDEAEIHCFDINLSKLEWKSKKAKYYECDLSEKKLDLPSHGSLAFFDDHVSHFDRLNYCLRNNISHIILDDDVAVCSVHSDAWPPIPTANMIMNYDDIPHKFEWVSLGRVASADISDLDCEPIKETFVYCVMPDLFDFTGYKNTSVTSFLVRR